MRRLHVFVCFFVSVRETGDFTDNQRDVCSFAPTIKDY